MQSFYAPGTGRLETAWTVVLSRSTGGIFEPQITSGAQSDDIGLVTEAEIVRSCAYGDDVVEQNRRQSRNIPANPSYDHKL
jgi:hypothetical protein